MVSTRSYTVGEGDDRIEFWKAPFDALFKELWSGVERARQQDLALPWESVITGLIPTLENRSDLINALRTAEVDYAHDAVFEVLSPGAHIESEEWESGGPMSGVMKRARIPTSERKQAIIVLKVIVDGLGKFWSEHETTQSKQAKRHPGLVKPRP